MGTAKLATAPYPIWQKTVKALDMKGHFTYERFIVPAASIHAFRGAHLVAEVKGTWGIISGVQLYMELVFGNEKEKWDPLYRKQILIIIIEST